MVQENMFYIMDFSNGGGGKYVGGVVSHVDCADIDIMSIVELNSILKQSLGYADPLVYFLKYP